MPDAGSWAVPGFGLVRPLGGGGTGTVVHAVHEASGRPVAIKYLSTRLLSRPEFVQRFRAEARALSGVADPNVARLLEYVEAPPAGAAIVMELVDGVTLRQVLDSQGRLRPEAALLLLHGSLRGLAAAHAVGVVHRDYKPGNVLVQRDGTSKLVDFGIAVRAGDGAVAEGTPKYMPPEQWAGAPLGPAADVYAATAVFFECLTGRAPYPQTELAALATAHHSAPIPLQDAPQEVQALFGRGLAKDPAARPPSAAAFLGELERVARAGYGPNWAAQGAAALVGAAGAAAAALPGAAALGGGPGGVPSGSPFGARADGSGADAMGTATAQGAGRPELARTGDSGPGGTDGGVGTTAVQQSGPGHSRTADGQFGQSGSDGLGSGAAQQSGPSHARSGEGSNGQSGSDGVGSAAAQDHSPRDLSSTSEARSGRRWRWPRGRAGRAALVAGAGVGVAAVTVAVVLLVRQPDQPLSPAQATHRRPHCPPRPPRTRRRPAR